MIQDLQRLVRTFRFQFKDSTGRIIQPPSQKDFQPCRSLPGRCQEVSVFCGHALSLQCQKVCDTHKKKIMVLAHNVASVLLITMLYVHHGRECTQFLPGLYVV